MVQVNLGRAFDEAFAMCNIRELFQGNLIENIFNEVLTQFISFKNMDNRLYGFTIRYILSEANIGLCDKLQL